MKVTPTNIQSQINLYQHISTYDGI